MMKKKIRVSNEPSSSSISYFPAGAEARARFKHHCLLQDYQELLKETEEKREKLKSILQKKLQLSAEVKFLRGKYQQLSTTPTTQYKLKKQLHRLPSPSVNISQPKNPVFHHPLKNRNTKAKQFPAPTSAPLLDLNQVFSPTGEEMEELEAQQRPQNVDWFKKISREGGDVFENDAVISVCRESRNGSNRTGKRKVSWQDQLALRV